MAPARVPDPPASSDRPLEPDLAVVRGWFDHAIGRALEHVASLADQPAAGPAPTAADFAALAEPIPEAGADPRPLIDRVVREWVPKSFTAAGPGYVAYVPGGGLPTGALADVVSGLTNRFVGIFAAAPMLARLEMTALRWLLDEFRFPASARGVFTSGGSIANLIALACAREKVLGESFADGVLYASDQTHHSMAKAARFLGFPHARFRTLPCDERLRLVPSAVAAAISEDRARGLRPAVVVANAGTVHTGALDPLDELADLARRERLWFHVDGAYGGFFAMTPEGRERLAGIERADSLTVDPHKGLFLPYGTGCLLVREGADLKRPHAMANDYLPQLQDDRDAQDFCEHSPELSRDFRGLRVWLSFKTFGASAFRAALAEKLALARRAERAIAAVPGLEIAAPVDLSLVAFRVARPGDEGDLLTRELLARVNARQRLHLSGTLVHGRFSIRICVLSFRTHADRIDEGLAQIAEETEALLGRSAPRSSG